MIDPEILEKEYQDALKCRVEGKILDIKKSKLNDCENTLEIYIKGKTSYYKIIGTENSDYAGKKLCLIYTDFPTYNEKNIEYYPKKGDFFQGVAEQSELKSNILLKYGKKAFNNSTDDFCNGVKIETVNKTGSSTGVISETSSNTGIISENKETKLSNTGVTNITNQENIKEYSLNNSVIKKPDIKIEPVIVKNESIINTGVILDNSDEIKENILNKDDLIIESKNELSQTGVIITKENYLEKPVSKIENNSQNYFIFGGIFIVIFIVIVGFFLQNYFKNKKKN